MEHLGAVQARIEAIRGMVSSSTPGAGFSAVLAQALRDTASASGGMAGVRAAGAGEAALLGAGRLGLGLGHGASGLAAPVDARVSSEFGPRVHPVTGERHVHRGMDFAAPEGTPVRAAAPGTVTFAGRRGGYGNLVIVQHGDGSETWYAHQRDLAVRAGQVVAGGETLGTVGSTGRSTGPHLHFELRRHGTAVDPLPMLRGAHTH